MIRDAVDCLSCRAELFKEYGAAPAQGCAALRFRPLRSDPDRQGVRELAAKKIAAARGYYPRRSGVLPEHQGPELLNIRRETDRHIRLIFQAAQGEGFGGTPVIGFFYEMDSIFRTRRLGCSSDVRDDDRPASC